MNAVFSIIILIAVIGLIIFLLSRRENTRRSQYGPAGLSEFRTTFSPMSAAGRTTAVSCSTSPSTSPQSSRWIPCTLSGWIPGGRPW